jgi:hypothetical protein
MMKPTFPLVVIRKGSPAPDISGSFEMRDCPFRDRRFVAGSNVPGPEMLYVIDFPVSRFVTVAITGPVTTITPFGSLARKGPFGRSSKSIGSSATNFAVVVAEISKLQGWPRSRGRVVPPGTAGTASAGPPTSSRAERLTSGTVMTRRKITRDFSRFFGVSIGVTIVTEVNIAIYDARSEPTRDRVAIGV